MGGFLDDPFVAPEARGRRVGEARIAEVAAEGRARGWSVIRWIAAGDNARAQALYDRVAERTGWVIYVVRL